MYKSRIYFKILDPYTTIVYIYLIDASKIIYSFELYCNICCKYGLIIFKNAGWIVLRYNFPGFEFIKKI